MSVAMVPLQQAKIRQYAKQLQLATVGGSFCRWPKKQSSRSRGI